MGLAQAFGRPGSTFYDGSTPERVLVKCRDCGHNADPVMGGDHGGDCIAQVKVPSPRSALGIVRAHALKHERFSMNDLREKFLAAGVKATSASPALKAAVKNGWIEPDGMEPSRGAKTKRHRIQVYRSLIFGTPPLKDNR